MHLQNLERTMAHVEKVSNESTELSKENAATLVSLESALAGVQEVRMAFERYMDE